MLFDMLQVILLSHWSILLASLANTLNTRLSLANTLSTSLSLVHAQSSHIICQYSKNCLPILSYTRLVLSSSLIYSPSIGQYFKYSSLIGQFCYSITRSTRGWSSLSWRASSRLSSRNINLNQSSRNSTPSHPESGTISSCPSGPRQILEDADCC